MARQTLLEELAGISRHGGPPCETAVRAGKHGFQDDGVHCGFTSAHRQAGTYSTQRGFASFSESQSKAKIIAAISLSKFNLTIRAGPGCESRPASDSERLRAKTHCSVAPMGGRKLKALHQAACSLAELVRPPAIRPRNEP